ncbi:MAG: lytic transglycosylase F [Desulfopila sp.]|nr:lytic transglycosylase F [Desulfopila sp.]
MPDSIFFSTKKTICFLLILLCQLLPQQVIAQPPQNFDEEELLAANSIFTGDLDAMVKRRLIRVLIPYNRTFFFFDGAEPEGISYENAKLFDQFLNKKFGTGTLKIHMLIIPTPRDKLFSWLVQGKGDIAIGNLTITDERLLHVDFSDPFAVDIKEILVTHRRQEKLANLFDLAGMEIHVRKSSSYFEHIELLNETFAGAGKKPITIVEANEHLEDSDLLEMVNADLIPAVIIDEHMGKFWENILTNIHLHQDIRINSGGRIAWALRKNSPQLKAVINEYAAGSKKGTLLGNVIINRYLKNTEYIRNVAEGEDVARFRRAVNLFKKYGDTYSFDHLMLIALAYQESRLNQELTSDAGAVGIMQMLPSTAKDQHVGITNIEKLEPNIHAGVKYLRFLSDTYFPADLGFDPLNRAFFTFAAYNAGPAKVASLRKEAARMGLDSNTWFNNVEIVAAKRIGRETVQYVSNILKYYVAYKLLEDRLEALADTPPVH